MSKVFSPWLNGRMVVTDSQGHRGPPPRKISSVDRCREGTNRRVLRNGEDSPTSEGGIVSEVPKAPRSDLEERGERDPTHVTS